ncbi:MAG: histidine kinase dimerization/phosphoacceptor domain -containing protein [Terracidiphilus sp.]
MSSLAIEQLPKLSRVLLVEDDSATAELVRRSLQRAGYSVEIADSVQAGLEALRGNRNGAFEALLLDYQLPDGEPWRVADAAHACVPEVPVVFVTGMSGEDLAIEALRRGFADYVKKTADFWNELPAVLERVARLSRMKGRLDETDALMRAIVEQSSDLVAVCTGDGTLVYLSPVCFALLGKHPSDLMGSSWTEIVAPEDRQLLLQMHAGLDQNPSQVAALRCRYKGGSLAWMEARVELLQAAAGTERKIVLTLHDVTAQREHERQIQSSLEEKEVLLREIHHRVKNNLQVVQSLLKMSARKLPDCDARIAVESTVERVHAMSMVHERLYQMPSLSALPLENYLSDLFAGTIQAYSLAPSQVQLKLDVEEILLPLDRAVPFALLANELLSNSFKHGFPGSRRGTIAVSVHRMEGAIRMVIEDDGVGLPANFDVVHSNSMGLKLAANLAHQLGGRLEYSSGQGCRVEADFTRM